MIVNKAESYTLSVTSEEYRNDSFVVRFSEQWLESKQPDELRTAFQITTNRQGIEAIIDTLEKSYAKHNFLR